MADLEAQKKQLEKQAEQTKKIQSEAIEKRIKAEQELKEAEDAREKINNEIKAAEKDIFEKGPSYEELEELKAQSMEKIQETYDQEKDRFMQQMEKKKQEQKAADENKKTLLQPKFDKLKEKVEAKKEQAAAEFKKGSYAESINLYKQSASLLDDAIESFPVFKKEIAQMEAAVFGNIAFCYGKDKQDKHQIEYCTKVIDRSLYLDDVSILTKAYLRRGLAYEHCERFKLAANDLTRVRQMDPMNKQARDSLTRCLKCIKQDEGIDYVPEGDDIVINTHASVENEPVIEQVSEAAK